MVGLFLTGNVWGTRTQEKYILYTLVNYGFAFDGSSVIHSQYSFARRRPSFAWKWQLMKIWIIQMRPRHKVVTTMSGGAARFLDAGLEKHLWQTRAAKRRTGNGNLTLHVIDEMRRVC